jgi:AmmeMemoRadiSam system protein A
MADILGVYLMPHPPLLIPEVGKGAEKRIQKTTDALNACCESIMEKAPKTIILITPHGHALNDCLTVISKERLEGNLSRFGAPMVSASFDGDTILANEIVFYANLRKIPCIGLDDELAFEYGISTSLDWGALVPLYFILKKYSGFKLVHMTVSMHSNETLYEFGMAVKDAIESKDRSFDSVIVCSGDLSNVLSVDGPYGYHPKGHLLDRTIIELIEAGDVKGLIELDKDLVEKGKECGLRSLVIGLGTLEGYNFTSRVLSYEGPFGVGYAVASFEPISKSSDRSISGSKISSNRYGNESEDPYLKLAKKSLEHYLRTGKILKADSQRLIGDMIKKKAGVFVSIKKGEKLRGCIGTIAPLRKNVAEEIIYNAVSAGTEDTRFKTIEENELGELVFSVDVLNESCPVKSLDDLDVKKYGVIVKSGRRTGLLLPDIEGVNTPQKQIEIALDKAGIRGNESYTIERFEVERHK